MIARPPDEASTVTPARPDTPLGLALAAMTGLQALVAVALFAPGVLAPRLGLGQTEIGVFTTAVFAVGALTSVYGGLIAARIGPFAVAALCAMAVTASMLTAWIGGWAALVIAGLLLGLAFGPETPASSTLLSKLARPEQRPLIFSVRQTGNQIGAMLGSLSLPLIAVAAPSSGFVIIAVLALAAGLCFLALRPRYDPVARGTGERLDIQGALKLVAGNPPMRRLALASMPFSAMQMALNTFFVGYAVGVLGQSHVTAGALLAGAQGGGLVGRLTWGLVATRIGSAHRVIVGLGLAMSVFAAILALAGPHWSGLALAAVAVPLGLTASDWNGVFLAEVARLAPDGRVAEATGAVLMASYTGLLCGPGIVAVVASYTSLSWSYALLATCTLLATLVLIGGKR